jgi:cell division septum initiation protein DivIVA
MDDRPDVGPTYERTDDDQDELATRRDTEPSDIDELDDEEDFERRVARRRPGADVEEILREVLDILDQARPAALSTAVKIDRDELEDLLEDALERLPEELRSARWLVKERDEFLARTQREADEILAAARGQSEQMVQRSEVMRSAEAAARRVVDDSKAEAARIRNECDDYCDQRLAQLEAVLERTLGVVGAGREKLRPRIDGEPRSEHTTDEADTNGEGAARVEVKMFDQDRL